MSFRERRIAERTWAYRDALLSIPRLKHVYSCGVRDLSNEGAGLRLNRFPASTERIQSLGRRLSYHARLSSDLERRRLCRRRISAGIG